MGLKRLLLLVVLAAAVALGIVSAAPAGVGIADDPCPTIAGENTNTCPAGTVGTPYSIKFHEAEGSGCGPGKQKFTIDSGSFPPGLTLASTGQVSGTPTEAGSFTFYIKIAEPQGQEGCAGSVGEKRFTIPINPGLPKLTLGPQSATPGTTGVPYSLQMTATVGDPKTWAISSGALPPGLAIDASTGLISGTPTATGQFNFEVYAKMIGDSRSDTKVLAIVVREPVAVVGASPFSALRRAQGEVGIPFSATLTASGGTGTYTWSSSGALPPGVLFVDGAISGTPNTAGVYVVTVTATDAEARVANYPARIVVADKLAISTPLLRPGKLGKAYRAKLTTLGGVKPTTLKLVSGPLPRGIRFDRVSGTLVGTPLRAGRYSLTFEATDSLAATSKKTLRLIVAP